MSQATKTIQQKLEYRPSQWGYFDATKQLYNIVAAFYFSVIETYPDVLTLNEKDAQGRLEQLTHNTKTNTNPPMPLIAVADNVPAYFRRAAIMAALGKARSFHSNLERWRKEKEAFEAAKKAQAGNGNNQTATPTTTEAATTTRGKVRGQKKKAAKSKQSKAKVTRPTKFTKRPPVPPRSWNLSPVYYEGMYKERTDSSIVIKLWTGVSWVKCKFGLNKREIPQEYVAGSPQLVRHGKKDWRLHTPVVKTFDNPGKAQKQFEEKADDFTICSVDLNLGDNIAVCTILTAKGTVVATKFIKGGRYLHGFRKRLLGKIAIKMRKTGLIAKGESFYRKGWERVSNLNDNAAHLVSRRIVDFARAHEANVLVFEHLTNLKPDKGRYSKRANQRRAHWLKGKIFQFSSYKAWAEGILTCRVSPRNTSKECHRCHALPLARYCEGQEPVGYTMGAPLIYCPNCGMRGNADRNAAIVIGQRLLTRFSQAETKPSRGNGKGKGKKTSPTQAGQTGSDLTI